MALNTTFIQLALFGGALLLGGGCASRQSPTATPQTPPPAPVESQPAQEDSGPHQGDQATASGSNEGGPAIAETGSAGGSGGGDGRQAVSGEDATPASGARTAGEQTSQLDERLDEKLQEFDGVLLEEQKRIEQQAGREGATSGGGTVDQGPVRADGGSGGAASTEERPGATGEQAGDSSTGPTSGSDGGGTVGAKPGGGGAVDSEADDRAPPDVGDGSDDDIIARQLREAAMAEEDPELRERLWDEYRRYKESIAGAEGGD